MTEPWIACLGEPLALVSAAALDAPEPAMHAGGAEANVAAGVAVLGTRTAFISRVGGDTEGARIVEHLRAHGVDVAGVEVERAGFTGRYAKTEGLDATGEPTTASTYRRAGSAAAGMDSAYLSRPAVAEALARAHIVHTSGITPALSASCAELTLVLLRDRTGVPGTVTFDVNWREQLWPSGDPSLVIRLARFADVVLVGSDEAERVLGTGEPAEVRALLPEPRTVIVKDGAVRAIAVARDGSQVSVPALSVEVVEPVGAGDSFAAGFLHGLAHDEDMRTCLRRGHAGAAATLTVRADFAVLPPEAMAALLACDEQDWADAHVGPGGVRVGGTDFPPPRESGAA
ncbi:sugar kinase [Tsukamurella pseudospumae]|uniref:Carbohydrate kinase n=1 Tax=Tsukamurella pseudospumae TaxID=239498 RepID=A0A137ZM60_9ACTN|nr:sugar kinase [Tsukamurella pseudospumae]KXO99255.1 carbohydrate kinase [Tsukamurella pseudospumae]